MATRWQIHPIQHGWANCFLVEADEELILIDTGRPGFFASFSRHLATLGKSLSDLRHIILTHAHPDHSGNALALQRASRAQIWAHPATAKLLAQGQTFQPYTARPDLVGWMVEKTVVSKAEHHLAPIEVDHPIQDGVSLPFAGDWRVIGTPGHTRGQVALLSPQAGGSLFVGDAMVNLPYLSLPYVAEDWPAARESASRLAQLDVQAIYFGHGKALFGPATARLKKRFGV